MIYLLYDYFIYLNFTEKLRPNKMHSCVSHFLVNCFCLTPSIVLSIVSLMIAMQYRETECDKNSISLSTWLIIMVSIKLTYLFFEGIYFSMLIFHNNFTNCGRTFFFSISIVTLIFVVIWNIIGDMILFGKQFDCYKSIQPIYTITLVTISFQFISFFFNVFNLICNRSTGEGYLEELAFSEQVSEAYKYSIWRGLSHLQRELK